MEDIVDAELVAEFVSEALQGLQAIEQDLLSLETDGGSDSALVNRIFRAIHTIKGNGSYLQLSNLVQVSHRAETLLDRLRGGIRACDCQVTDAVLGAVDALTAMLQEESLGAEFNCEAVLRKLDKALGHPAAETNVSPTSANKDESTATALAECERNWSGKGSAYALHVDLETLHAAIDIKEGVVAGLSSVGRILGASMPVDLIDRTTTGRCSIYFETILEPGLIRDHFGIPLTSIQALPFKRSNEPRPISVVAPNDGNGSTQQRAAKQTEVQNLTVPQSSSQSKPIKPVEASLVDSSHPDTTAVATHAKNSGRVTAEQTMRVPVHILHELLEWTGTMVMARNQLMNEYSFASSTAFRTLSQAISGVHETVIATRMQTTGSLFERYRRVVRDLSRQVGKEVAFHIEGGELELDRSILESFADPLTHLIRNSLDHALETPAEREAAGKNRQGNVYLRSYIQSGEIILEVADDGRGIDSEKVCDRALSKGVITREEAQQLSDRDKMMLIFRPGFSTKEVATDLSGRGVGMDVVKNNIEGVGGTIDVQTRLGQGSTFAAILPLAKALVSSSLTEALIVDVQGERFAIPETAVSEIISFDEYAITNIAQVDGQNVFQLRDKLIALVDLRQALGLTTDADPRTIGAANRAVSPSTSQRTHKRGATCLVVLQFRKHLFCVIVDQVIGIQEIIVRSTPKLLQRYTVFCGHTVLGNGAVALILDVSGLVTEMNLKFVEPTVKPTAIRTAESILEPASRLSKKRATQKMVVFSYAQGEYFAIPLELVAIIERIRPCEIRTVGEKEFLQIKQETISVLRLDQFLSISPFSSNRNDCCLIRPAAVSYPIGIITGPDVKVVEVDDDFESRTDDNKGIVGTFIHEDKLVMLLDIFSVFERHAPDKLGLHELNTQNAKILVAEDSLFFRKLIAQYIQRPEWNVEIVNDGLEAWERLQAEPNRFNLVISDINMPRMDGFELAVRIREDRRFDELPLVALTTLSDDHFREKGISVGFDQYVVKIDKSQVRATVAECLRIKRKPTRV